MSSNSRWSGRRKRRAPLRLWRLAAHHDVRRWAMTIAAVWLRNIGDARELVFASDSRLTGGYAWDACPKILPLARQDCAVCFAGDTAFAYPVMLQIASAVRAYRRSLDRSQDIHDFKGRILDFINGMRAHIHSPVHTQDPTGQEKTFLLFGGYSWRKAEFAIWTLHFDSNLDAFTFRPTTPWRGVDGNRLLAVAGDEIDTFKTALTGLLRLRRKIDTGGFDMEPLEVIRDMIRAEQFETIGGPVQVVKIYRHLNATPLCVYWPNAESGAVSLLGRTLLKYEQPSTGILDPDSLAILEPNNPAANAGVPLTSASKRY